MAITGYQRSTEERRVGAKWKNVKFHLHVAVHFAEFVEGTFLELPGSAKAGKGVDQIQKDQMCHNSIVQ